MGLCVTIKENMTQPRKSALISGTHHAKMVGFGGGHQLKRRISESSLALNSVNQRRRQMDENVKALMAMKRKSVSL